jgi:NAD(P)-dependent dehydrogenase (short-subunit alcohol dehydrogenase family)
MAQGKVALVTGGGTGIGQAAALALQGDGWNVAITGRRKAELDKTVAMAQSGAKAGGGRMVAIPADVGKPDDVKRLFAEVQKAFGGRLDFLFNNAGMGAPPVAMEDLTYEQWMAVVSVNLTGSFLCAQEAIKIMKSQNPRAGASSTTARSRPTPRGRTRCPIRPPSTPSPASPSASRWTGASTTSRAGSSTSATPTPRSAGA